MQRCLRLCAKCQHLQAGVELPQLLLQAEGTRHWRYRERPARPLECSSHGADHTGGYQGVLAYLGVSELLGMKAKSRRGKKSLGPIIPKPLVRFGCILCGRNQPPEPQQRGWRLNTAPAGNGCLCPAKLGTS